MSAIRGRLTLANARVWRHVSAQDRPLGRLAVKIATILMGKHKPHYDPSADNGDYVVVTNCEHLQVSNKKDEDHKYYSHSGKPGNLKVITMRRLKEKFGASEILRRAVSGMLPKNRLRARRMERLKAFNGKGHPYQKNLIRNDNTRDDLPSPFRWSQMQKTAINNVFRYERLHMLNRLKSGL